MTETNSNHSQTSQSDPLLFLKPFPLGTLMIRQNVLQHVHRAAIYRAMHRHRSGDWGNVNNETWKANDLAFAMSNDIISRYRDQDNPPFYVVTQGDRQTTVIFLEEDFKKFGLKDLWVNDQ